MVMVVMLVVAGVIVVGLIVIHRRMKGSVKVEQRLTIHNPFYTGTLNYSSVSLLYAMCVHIKGETVAAEYEVPVTQGDTAGACYQTVDDSFTHEAEKAPVVPEVSREGDMVPGIIT